MAVLLNWRQTWDGTDLEWTETWGEGSGGAASVAATGTVTFAATGISAGEFSFAAASVYSVVNSTFSSANFNVPGSTSVLWEGTEKLQGRGVSFAGVADLGFLSNVGSAFSITDDQTAMAPSGGSVYNATVIAVSSFVASFQGGNQQDFAAVSIAATGSLGFDGVQVGGAELAVPSTAAATFNASPLQRGDFTIAAATAATPWAAQGVNPRGALFAGVATVTFGPFSRADGAARVAPTGFVEFGQTAGAVAQGAFDFASTGALGFTGDSKAITAVGIASHLSAEFGQPGGGVEFGALVLTHQLSLDFAAESIGNGAFRIAPHGTFNFSSTDFVEEDDDLAADADPRKFWEAAAQQEAWERDKRRLGRIARIDEDDLLTLSAALSQAIGQATARGVVAR